MEQFHILVIEDELHIAEGIKLHLELKNYRVTWARDGQAGLEAWASQCPDLIILDIMMPKVDGHKVLELIRKKDERLPVLILSARDGAQDKVRAFLSGVDDYLAKPFDAQELCLRVERLLLKSSWYQEQTKSEGKGQALERFFNFGPFKVDLQSGVVEKDGGDKFTLTEQELRLLKVFIIHRLVPMARKDLLALAWQYGESVETRTLDNFIVRLRRYFEVDPKQPKYFKSMRSLGYLFDPSSENDA